VLARIAALGPGEAVTHEHRVLRPDGAVGWQQWTDRAIGDPVAEYQAVGRDVTPRKEAEAAAGAAAERTALALAAGRIGTWEWDVASDRVAWDEAQRRLFGLGPGEPPATVASFHALVHPEDRRRLEQASRDGGPFEDEYRILRPGRDDTVDRGARRGVARRVGPPRPHDRGQLRRHGAPGGR
jgi:PAS domain-containing protein